MGETPVPLLKVRNFRALVAFNFSIMRNALLIFMAVTFGVVPLALAATYSTEATMSLQKDEGIYNVAVSVSELTERNGKTVERVIAKPRIQSSPGVPATLHTGDDKETVTVDVSWPYPNESGTASCVVVVKQADEVMSKSRFQLKVEGPGRVPLVLAAPDVDAKSVKVAEVNSQSFVLLELAGKSQQEVKKLAVENYGNKVQIRDAQGNLTGGGFSFGTYHDTGLTIQFPNEEEAKRVARVLSAGGGK
jgi:hypothetical protein